jgi:hypothetical protein
MSHDRCTSQAVCRSPSHSARPSADFAWALCGGEYAGKAGKARERSQRVRSGLAVPGRVRGVCACLHDGFALRVECTSSLVEQEDLCRSQTVSTREYP